MQIASEASVIRPLHLRQFDHASHVPENLLPLTFQAIADNNSNVVDRKADAVPPDTAQHAIEMVVVASAGHGASLTFKLVLPIRHPANHGRPLQKPTTHESQKN